MKLELPRAEARILKILEQNGFEAYFVGGCVRDCLMGQEPHDWDLATSALPEQVKAVFAGYPVIIAVRLKDEEDLLTRELPGYGAYKQKIRYRLIPFIW